MVTLCFHAWDRTKKGTQVWTLTSPWGRDFDMVWVTEILIKAAHKFLSLFLYSIEFAFCWILQRVQLSSLLSLDMNRQCWTGGRSKPSPDWTCRWGLYFITYHLQQYILRTSLYSWKVQNKYCRLLNKIISSRQIYHGLWRHSWLTPMEIILWNAFSWMKSFIYQIKYHWSLFPRVQLTILQHRFR